MEPSLLSIRPIFFSSASLLLHGGTSKRSGRPAAWARASAWCARSISCAPRQPRDGCLHPYRGYRPGFPLIRRPVPASWPYAGRGLGRSRSHHQNRAGSQRHQRSLFRQSSAMARRRPLAFDVPACKERLRRFVGQLQMQLCRGPAERAQHTGWGWTLRLLSGGRADLVLAKSSLLKHCRNTGLPHIAFENFSEATKLLAGWLEERGTVVRDQSARAVETK